MMRYGMLGLGVVLCLVAGCGGGADNIQGTWMVESAEMQGKPAPPDEIKQQQIVISADKFTVVREKVSEKDEETYKIDPRANPKTIDMTMTIKTVSFGKVGDAIGNGGAKVNDPEPKTTTQVKNLKGIYKLEGDKLIICFGGPDQERPKEFKGQEEQMLIVLKRAK